MIARRLLIGVDSLLVFRTRLALAGVLLFLLVFCGRPEAPAPAVARPDIVLFVIDTLRADHLSCYGYARGTSPNLDRFATTGVRCTTASSQSSWTAPSMVSMMTSRFVASDFKKMPSDKGVKPLAEQLQAAGYRTVGFQFNVLLGHGSGFERGFDEYLVEPSLKELLERVEAKSTSPTFFYFHFVEPHDPYKPAPEFDLFQPIPLAPKRVDELRDYLAEREPMRPAYELQQAAREAAKEIAAEIARYDGEIRAIDSKFGDLIKILEKRGTLANTLIVVGSDHGECLWEHRESVAALQGDDAADLLKAFKRTHNTLLNESLLHVPLIMAGPGIPQGMIHDSLVANVDIVPTLLELVDLPVPGGIDGRSLVSDFATLATGGKAAGREISFANTTLFTSARTASGYKLILPWDREGPDRPQFFNLLEDPDERNPLTTEGEVRARLEAAIKGVRRTGLEARSGEALVDEETARRMKQLGY